MFFRVDRKWHFVIILFLVLPASGCSVLNRFDVMINEIRHMRCQLGALEQTNQRMATLNQQMSMVEHQLSALQQTNSGIDQMSGELRQVRVNMESVDRSMSELATALSE